MLFSLISCTHSVHNYHVSAERFLGKSKNKKRIKSEAQQAVVFWMADNTNYVNEAFEELQRKCRKGRIVGNNTRFSTSHGFFSWTNKVKMQAYCVR